MRTLSLTFYSALLASTSAKIFAPKDLPDGAYFVTYDEAGKQSHHLIEPHNSTALAEKVAVLRRRVASFEDSSSEDAVTKRQSDGYTNCAKAGWPVRSDDVFNAVAGLDRTCDTGNYFGRDQYYKVGGAVSYVCNYSRSWQQCWGSENNKDFAQVWRECVPGAAQGNPPPSTYDVGWVTHKDWGPKNYGYGSQNNGWC